MKEDLASFWNKYQIIIWPFLGGGIAIALLFLVIFPQIIKIMETNNQIKETKQKVIQLKQKADLLDSLDLNEYKQHADDLSVVIPSQVEAASTIGQLQTIATSTNVQITSFNFVLAPSETSKDFTIKLNFTGQGTSINDFIAKLKTLPRLITISRIGISTQKDDTAEVALELKSYIQNDQNTIGSIDQGITPLSEADKANLAKIETTVKSISITPEEEITGDKGKPNPFE